MNIKYNNHTPEEYGAWLATRPVITPSELEIDRYKIPGRQGELIGQTQTRGNAHITFKLHTKASSGTASLDSAINWITTPGGYLQFYKSGEYDNYKFEVITSEVKSIEDLADDYIRAEIEMEVYPFKYKVSGTQSGRIVQPGGLITFNISSSKCEPLYMFECTLVSGKFTVNGYEMFVKQGSGIYVDVRRKLTYTMISSVKQNQDDKINGDYDGITLKSGYNQLSTSDGVTLTIVDSREGYII